ncbi:Hsp20 family protein [Gluconacetobacter takamatsuzukensis]|uniref:Hsp20 family protein n=1 Tax=Gluconacetobacter takamatsuzukensis TaxID=1286190 RepID=A0A7W4KGM4_9PROT|nr:Hsp20 family protein [Gluconacetobacter takamatsuzukensis]MBB2206460.1 Hsp20 family protein [Gluconacetobacter takamatsuzukensis]
MRATVDFAPLFRSSVGFDRMLNAIDLASRIPTADNWPPYDIVKTGEDDYRIDMAVAGLAENDLAITQERNTLIVTGRKEPEQQSSTEYIHRGIAGREFERRFDLAEHMKVTDARFENGLLSIILKREIPEAMKPRRITITSSTARRGEDVPRIEAQKEAA